MAQLSKIEESSQATTTVQIIRGKFPERNRMKLAKRQHQHGSYWEVPHLLNTLDSIIEELEAVSNFEQPQLGHVETTLIAHTQRCSPNPYSKRSYVAPAQHPPSPKNRDNRMISSNVVLDPFNPQEWNDSSEDELSTQFSSTLVCSSIPVEYDSNPPPSNDN
ncbi:hypothetical protein OESDEN_09549 [Oesophagostomum dentatum]|uniref:Uncharacterized protein n=1 Tax=Oesophagostomum dentatum TaxID=61180 RepID=A0A0B1T398_OESDE|nr:hypothetical protein OESDEN_09549 [Oesophagostomum dentatum]